MWCLSVPEGISVVPGPMSGYVPTQRVEVAAKAPVEGEFPPKHVKPGGIGDWTLDIGQRTLDKGGFIGRRSGHCWAYGVRSSAEGERTNFVLSAVSAEGDILGLVSVDWISLCDLAFSRAFSKLGNMRNMAQSAFAILDGALRALGNMALHVLTWPPIMIFFMDRQNFVTRYTVRHLPLK